MNEGSEFIWETMKTKRKSDDGKVRAANESIRRAKVPGGWLVHLIDNISGMPVSGLAFYPDPDHNWTGKTLS